MFKYKFKVCILLFAYMISGLFGTERPLGKTTSLAPIFSVPLFFLYREKASCLFPIHFLMPIGVSFAAHLREVMLVRLFKYNYDFYRRHNLTAKIY